jgi:5-methylcytosine-specific restriction endonuclease McrA
MDNTKKINNGWFKKGHTSPNKGKKLSLTTRHKISLQAKERFKDITKHPMFGRGAEFSGENNPNWKGGLPTCKDCGRTLSNRNSIRCKYCAPKELANRESMKILFKKRAIYTKNPIYNGGVSRTKKYIKLHHQRRKAIENGGGFLSVKTIQEIYEENIKKYGTLTCIYCIKPITFGQDTLEHKTPLSRGGTNEKKNLAIACAICNSKKGNKTYEEYAQQEKNGQAQPV